MQKRLPLFPEQFKRDMQQIGYCRAGYTQYGRDLIVGEVFVKFQINDLLLPVRQSMQHIADLFLRLIGMLGRNDPGLNVLIVQKKLVPIFKRNKDSTALLFLEDAVSQAFQQIRFDLIRCSQKFPAVPQGREKIVDAICERVLICDQFFTIIK